MKYDDLRSAVADLCRAEEAVEKASKRRGAHPPGSSRARLQTLNADYTNACERRDRIAMRVAAIVVRVGIVVASDFDESGKLKREGA